MQIKEFTKYKKVLIQCHDIPDADALASAYGIQHYLQNNGVEADIIYGGRVKITKPNLLLMLELMGITAAHVTEADLPPHDLLLLVDCQYGAGNVTRFPTENFAVIDHHRAEIPEGDNVCIRPSLGSCATLVWDLLRAEDYPIERDENLCNALYYGLFTDTNGLSELSHPLDRDMAEILPVDIMLIKKLKNSAITIGELDIVGSALADPQLVDSVGFIEARPCDPNILGFTSDIAQQVQQMDCVVVFCRASFGGLKLSVRSSVREVMANEFAAFLAKGVGSGGGNIEKAGGFLSYKDIAEKHGDIDPVEFLRGRISAYNRNYDHVYANKHSIDFDAMPRYRKLPKPVGYARTTDCFPSGTPLTIRTLEGDIDTKSSDEIYIMIGIYGEVYPIQKEKFLKSYIVTGDRYDLSTEYTPTVTNKITGEKKLVPEYAGICVPTGEKIICAAPVERDTKVFTFWDREKYFYGTRGDFIAANVGDYGDCYLIRRDIFLESYEKIEA